MPIERIIAHVESKQKTLEETSSKAGKTKNDEPVLQKYIKKFCSSIAERFVESDFGRWLFGRNAAQKKYATVAVLERTNNEHSVGDVGSKVQVATSPKKIQENNSFTIISDIDRKKGSGGTEKLKIFFDKCIENDKNKSRIQLSELVICDQIYENKDNQSNLKKTSCRKFSVTKILKNLRPWFLQLPSSLLR